MSICQSCWVRKRIWNSSLVPAFVHMDCRPCWALQASTAEKLLKSCNSEIPAKPYKQSLIRLIRRISGANTRSRHLQHFMFCRTQTMKTSQSNNGIIWNHYHLDECQFTNSWANLVFERIDFGSLILDLKTWPMAAMAASAGIG